MRNITRSRPARPWSTFVTLASRPSTSCAAARAPRPRDPYPIDPADATGPMRLVLSTFPRRPRPTAHRRRSLAARLAACAQLLPVRSRYWWKGQLNGPTTRSCVVFKTAPKRVGALFRRLGELHPYDVPEVVEIDVPRVHPPYLAYLAETIDAEAPPPPLGGGRPPVRRRGARRAPGSSAPCTNSSAAPPPGRCY